MMKIQYQVVMLSSCKNCVCFFGTFFSLDIDRRIAFTFNYQLTVVTTEPLLSQLNHCCHDNIIIISLATVAS